jgi:hypothetical protein
MKKLILSLAFLSVLASGAQAGVTLGTSNPPGMPLMVTAGTTSGPLFVDIVSDNSLQDVMPAWNFQLEIIPDSGATGALTFQDPSIGTPPNPPNYIFDTNGLGIAATNLGSLLSANDFYDPSIGLGTLVPGAPGANLLQVDFLASPSASGLFGIYAVQGAALTQWTDDSFTTQFFTDVPDGTGAMRIGDVLVTPSLAPQPVPEPASLMLLALGGAALTGWGWRRKRK